ncbi:MAG: carbonic anhydrase [Pseudomonadota bacterium]
MDARRALEFASIRVSIDNLRSFPFVRERENDGRLQLHGAYFDICVGMLRLLDPRTGQFAPLNLIANSAAAA